MFTGNVLSFSQQQVDMVCFLIRKPSAPWGIPPASWHLVYIVLVKGDSIVIGELKFETFGAVNKQLWWHYPHQPSL